jgi:hypothetical protein
MIADEHVKFLLQSDASNGVESDEMSDVWGRAG